MPTGFQGAIFDIDGVLVDSPHEKAWRESLRELMESEWAGIRDQTTWSPEAFTSLVYQEQMSGKPRMSGARSALEYFRVPDVEEHATDVPLRGEEAVQLDRTELGGERPQFGGQRLGIGLADPGGGVEQGLEHHRDARQDRFLDSLERFFEPRLLVGTGHGRHDAPGPVKPW